jgi:hypothetical protein
MIKPGIIYKIHRPTLLLPKIDSPPKIAFKPPSHEHAFQRSMIVSHPPDQYGFSTTFSIINVPSYYS